MSEIDLERVHMKDGEVHTLLGESYADERVRRAKAEIHAIFPPGAPPRNPVVTLKEGRTGNIQKD